MLLALADLPFIGIFLLVLMFLGGWLVFVPLIITAIFVSISLRQSVHLRRITEETGEQYERRFNFILETLSGIQTVKALSAESQMLRRFERLLEGSILGRRSLAVRQGAVQMMGGVFTQTLTVLYPVAFEMRLLMTKAVGSLRRVRCCQAELLPVQAALSVWLRRQATSSRNNVL